MQRTGRRGAPGLRLCAEAPGDGGGDGGGDGARLLAGEHGALQRLCDRLEQIADNLPRPPAPAERDAVCRALRVLVPRHRAREQAVLAGLFGDGRATAAERRLLRHIRMHHALDELHAQDLGAALEAPLPPQAETLGYMLRCFFDNCRRALAFEELLLLTAGRRPVPAAALSLAGGRPDRAAPDDEAPDDGVLEEGR